MHEANERNLAAAYERFAHGDLTPLLDLLREDVTWQATGGGPVAGTYVGKQRVKAFFAAMQRAYEGTLQLEVRAILANTAYGVVLARESGAYRGQPLSYSSVHVFTFDESGRCTRFLALQDDDYDRFWDQQAATGDG